MSRADLSSRRRSGLRRVGDATDIQRGAILFYGCSLPQLFNHARPHMSLGPGIPAALRPLALETAHRHRIPAGHTVQRVAVLGGLHHEYWLEEIAA